MSDNGDFSIWSNDEIELLDNIKKEIKLGNSGSDTDSSKLNKADCEVWKVLQKNDMDGHSDVDNVREASGKSDHTEEFSHQQSNSSLSRLKSHFSSNDLSNLNPESATFQKRSVREWATSFTHSKSYNCLSNSGKSVSKKYDHVQSKIKQYFNAENPVKKTPPKEMSNVTKAGEFENNTSLEEINLRLTRELEEKNAVITQLQENYENLLLKYAEAQNKIDQLRFKSCCESAECQVHSSAQRNTQNKEIGDKEVGDKEVGDKDVGDKDVGNKEERDSVEEDKCEEGAAALLTKNDFQVDFEIDDDDDRPSSLEGAGYDGNVIKIGTPTDSEGMSSVITSMSGHSKILNSLNVHGAKNMNFKLMKYSEMSYILGDSPVVHDPFRKVKNWQKSLPPLECIETPETALYDGSQAQISLSAHHTKGNNTGGDGGKEVFPPKSKKKGNKGDECQIRLNDNMRAISLPGPLKQEKDTESGRNFGNAPSYIAEKHKKNSQLLRCSSLPNYISPKSTTRDIYIPRLDLENLSYSDAESSHVYYYGHCKHDLGTSSSYVTSQSGSMELPSQTYRSNYKGRTASLSVGPSAEPSDAPSAAASTSPSASPSKFPFSGRPSFNKSTSITPDRCNDAFPSSLRSSSLCRVCGEKLEDRSLPIRSISYQTFLDLKDAARKLKEKRSKYPFSRSISFNSETSSFRKCFHNQDCLLRRTNEDSLEKFEIYTNNLRARSQVVMKALAAHVNST